MLRVQLFLIPLHTVLATGSNIPTPDADGVVQEFDTKYPPLSWHEPYSYIKFSDNVEDSVQCALTGNYTYLIDEGDSVWLDKNNKLARGEGSSSSPAPPSRGAVAASRSSKARGKDPELSSPFVITEDEFELIMGLLEKLTDEKCPFLHLVRSSGCCSTTPLIPLFRMFPVFLPSPNTNSSSPTLSPDPSSLHTVFHPMRHPRHNSSALHARYTLTGATGRNSETDTASFHN